MTFNEVILEAAKNRELVSNFDRLFGTNLSLRGAPIELMIDDATGKLRHDVELFVAFVFDYVWLPLLDQAAEEAHRQAAKTAAK